MAVWDDFMGWLDELGLRNAQVAATIATMKVIDTEDVLDLQYNNLRVSVKTDPTVVAMYNTRKQQVKGRFSGTKDPVTEFIEGALDKWVVAVGDLTDITPGKSKERLAEISANVIKVWGASAAIDYLAGTITPSGGDASSANTKELLKWLGFGAVIAAVAHDPLKIGLLRPYQDHLEATFRNRRPEYVGILNAYKQRSLSTIAVVNDSSIPVGGETRIVDGKDVLFIDLDKITDEDMDKIETDNNTNMDFYGAQWGYPQKWITIEKDAATKAMTFGNLMAMARLGYYDKGMSLFSMWTFGIDRRLIKTTLKAIETSRDVGMWKGFRSMVEPSYVQGLIEESDLVEYWTKILVPPDVQTWALLRLRNSRAKFAAKELKLETAASKDLTKSDWMQAYERGIISLAEFESKLHTLGYDDAEISILVKLADSKKVGPASTACKHLSLSDYELAHRNGILTLEQVLARMQNEYCQADIDLEKQLLMIEDITSDAPAAERDLTVSQMTTAYLEDIITLPKYKESLTLLGFDDSEIAILVKLADVKKEILKAKGNKGKNAGGITAERDLTLAQLTAAYVQNVIDEASYTSDIGSLGYDAAETAILLKLAQVKKKLPSMTGLKRLPLGDYEKAWKASMLTSDQVLDRMRGEYRDEDIQLERLLLSIGKP